MLFSLWSAKAGSGCTAVAIALADAIADRHGRCLLVDLGGDVPSCAGLDPSSDGLTDWLAATQSPIDSISRLELTMGRSGVDLLPLGGATRWSSARSDTLIALLGHEPRPVVVDVGRVGAGNRSCLEHLGHRLVEQADHSLLVSRPCYLSMRRAIAAPVRPNGVILVRENARALDAFDVASLLAVPVVAQVDHDPMVSRAIDSGTFAARIPRTLSRQVRGAL